MRERENETLALTDEMETAAVIHMASAAFVAEAGDDRSERRIRRAIVAACLALWPVN